MPNPVKTKPDYGTPEVESVLHWARQGCVALNSDSIREYALLAHSTGSIGFDDYMKITAQSDVLSEQVRDRVESELEGLASKVQSLKKRGGLDTFQIDIIDKAVKLLAPVVLSAGEMKLTLIYTAIMGWIDSRKKELMRSDKGSEQGWYDHQGQSPENSY